MKKSLFIVVSIFVSLFLIVACGNQENVNEQGSQDKQNGEKTGENTKVKKMVISSTGPEDWSQSKALAKFAKIVEEKTNGGIKAELFYDSQLGGDLEAINGMKIGTIQATTMTTGPLASVDESFNVFGLPFLFDSKETAYEVLDGPIGQQILDNLKDNGIIGLNFWELGFRNLTNNIREVTTPEDVAGLKIRTLENDLSIATWTELGAIPTPISWPELYVSLQQGVVDGQENPFSSIKVGKLYEVQKYLTDTRHVYGASPLLISKKFWDTLTGEEKEILKQAADEAQKYQRDIHEEETNSAKQILIDSGMVITELTAEQRAMFVEKMSPVYEKFESAIGEELVDKVIKAVKN